VRAANESESHCFRVYVRPHEQRFGQRELRALRSIMNSYPNLRQREPRIGIATRSGAQLIRRYAAPQMKSSRSVLSRRSLLKVLGAAPFAPMSLGLVACGTSSDAHGGASVGFLTDEDKRGLNALANVVIPPEAGSPGGSDMLPANYVERLLTAFDVDPPALFCDGPFSGRAPLPDGVS